MEEVGGKEGRDGGDVAICENMVNKLRDEKSLVGRV